MRERFPKRAMISNPQPNTHGNVLYTSRWLKNQHNNAHDVNEHKPPKIWERNSNM